MFKVKIKRLFKLVDKQMEPNNIVELTKKEVDAIREQLDESYIEIVEEIEVDEVDYNEFNVDQLKELLADAGIEHDAKLKPDLVAVAEENKEKLAEVEKDEVKE